MIFSPRRASLVALGLVAALACGCDERPAPSPAPAPARATSSAAPRSPTPSPTPSLSPSPSPTASSSAAPADLEPVAPGDAANDNPRCSRRKSTGLLTACEKIDGAPGAWTPTPRELAGAVGVAGGLCYCAGALEEQALACAKKVGAGALRFTIGAYDDPTDCTVRVVPVASKGERLFVMAADNRDLATFYAVLAIVEQRATGATAWFRGFNDMPSDAEIAAGARGVSPAMRAAWPKLSPEARTAIGAAVAR
jgi:hypothetical protein